MSLMKTFPIWAPTAIATEQGWCDPRTKEVYVSLRGLKSRLEAEGTKPVAAPVVKYEEPVVVETAPVVIEEKPTEIKEEVKMEQTVEEVKVKRPYNKKVRQVNEAVEEPTGVQIIGEVVEYKIDQPVIGE
jgi:hypothetical protein